MDSWKKAAKTVLLLQKVEPASKACDHRYHFLRVLSIAAKNYFTSQCSTKKSSCKNATISFDSRNMQEYLFKNRASEQGQPHKMRPFIKSPMKKLQQAKGSAKKLSAVSLIQGQQKLSENSDEGWRSLMKKQEERQFQITR